MKIAVQLTVMAIRIVEVEDDADHEAVSQKAAECANEVVAALQATGLTEKVIPMEGTAMPEDLYRTTMAAAQRIADILNPTSAIEPTDGATLLPASASIH